MTLSTRKNIQHEGKYIIGIRGISFKFLSIVWLFKGNYVIYIWSIIMYIKKNMIRYI